MKVGILTFNRTLNYGAVLQMYALYSSISSLGAECKVVDYQCRAVEEEQIGFILKNKKSLKQIIKNVVMCKIQNEKLKKFDDFVKQNIILTEERYTRENIELLNDQFDDFIVGSDQVWNLEITNGDLTYFLDFVKDNSKKKSYAASFGYSKIPAKYELISKTYLNSFSILNVREESGKKIIENLHINKDTEITIDPTLLLNKNQWKEIIGNNNRIKGKKYILVYLPYNSKETFNLIKKYAKLRKCEIRYIHSSIFNKFGMINLKKVSPTEFLDLILNAECIITGSFHAMCFSLIFNKNFYYTVPPIANRSSRLTNLCNAFLIQDREFTEKNIMINSDVNYNEINKMLELKKYESLKILKKSLKKTRN